MRFVAVFALFLFIGLGFFLYQDRQPWSEEKIGRCSEFFYYQDDPDYSVSYAGRIRQVMSGCFFGIPPEDLRERFQKEGLYR